MFKLPSLQSLYTRGRQTLVRFPLVLLCAAACAAVSVIIAHTPAADKELYRYVITLTMGIPLFFAVHLNFEICHSDRSLLKRYWPLLFGGAFIVLLFLSYNQDIPNLYYFRYFQLNLGMHLLVAFTPFLFGGGTNGFWQFNKTLFLRFLLSYLYVTALYIGLAVALWAVSYLLSVNIDRHIYTDLYIVLVFVFNTWFFLAGMPDDITALEQSTEYPEGLKVFTQYVLIPLVTLYLGILYLYMGKILLHTQWPKGTIGYLVSGVSILGILNLLLVYPFQFLPGNVWIKAYAKGFYGALFPLIILMGMGTWQRVSEYGVTERRYFLIVIALWITGIALYFMFSKIKNIKVIPITLALLAFSTSFGPWSAYQVSKFSQLVRFKRLLTAHGMLENGKINSAQRNLDFETKKELSSMLSYFHDMQGFEPLQPFFNEPIHWKTGAEVAKAMGFDFTNMWQNQAAEGNSSFYYNVNTSTNAITSIVGYDVLCDLPYHGYGPHPSYRLNDRTFQIVVASQPAALEIRDGSRPLISLSMDAFLNELKAGGRTAQQQSQEKMTLTGENENAKVMAQFSTLQGNFSKELVKLNNATGRVFLKLKK